MSYAFRAAGANSIGNAKQTGAVALPAGIQVGDLLIAFLSISQGGSTFTQPTVNTPSGWTQLGSTLTNQGTSAGMVGAWYYRWADGNDTAPSWTLDSSVLFKYAAVVCAWSGGPGSGVPAITTGNGATGSSTTTNTAPTAALGATPTWFAEFYSERSTTNGSYTTPSGTTLRASGFGTGGAAADLLVVDSNGNFTGTDAGDATTAGTSATWSINATIVLPPVGVASSGTATLSLSAGASVGVGGATAGAAAVTALAAATYSPVKATVAASVSLLGISVPTVAPVAFRNSAALTNNSNTASSFNPSGVLAGDLLVTHLIVATGGTNNPQPATPTPTGYTLLGTTSSQSATAGTVGAWYYRWATGTDTAPSIQLDPSITFKWTCSVTAHSGGDGSSVPQIVMGTDPQNTSTTHTAEAITPAQSTWVMSSFGIRSTTNGSFTTPPGTTALAEIFGTGGGAPSAAIFDTHADVSGLVPGVTTVADTASTYGVHASITIPPKGGHPQSAAAALSVSAFATSRITNAANNIGWGLSNNALAGAEAALGRPVDFLRDYGWIQGLTPNLTALASQRRVILSMKFRTSAQGVVPATDVTSNLHDADIQKFINAFIALPNCPAGPHILCFEHEDDAQTAQQSGSVAQLVAASQHCITMARNTPGWDGLIATIITGGSGSSYGTQLTAVQRAALFTGLYNVSDCVGIDNPYINSYPGSSGDANVGPVVDWFNSNYPTMPLFIGEWGAQPGTGTQRADWITAFAAALTKARYHNVFAVTYWNNGAYALNAAGLTAWAAGGQRAQGIIGGDSNLTLTAAATTGFRLMVTSADAAITVTGAANVTSSTGATHPAAVLTLAASATITGPFFAVAQSATITLAAAVGAPPSFQVNAATAFLDLEASATITFLASDQGIAGAFVDLEASAIGPPVVAHIVPVNVRVRITSTVDGLDYDISQFCGQVEITRGRTTQLETSIAAGTCTLTLDDSASTFDPDNTQSPLFGFLNPGWQSPTTVHVDEFVPALGAYVDWFCGGIQSLDRTFTAGDISITTLVAVDQTFDLSKHIPAAGTVLPAELPGARITRLIGGQSRTGWMWTSRSQAISPTQIDPGQKMLAAVTTDGSTSSWTYANGAAQAEGGLLFFDAAGVLTFSSQADRLTSNVVWNLGDQAGMTPVETDLEYSVSTDNMILDYAVTTGDGNSYLYGPGGASFVASGGTFNADGSEQSQLGGWNSAAARAHYVYDTRSVPRRDAPTVTLNFAPVVTQWAKSGAPTAWQVAVQARISDLASITRTPSQGDPIVANYWVEGMHITIGAAGVGTCSLNVSRADGTATTVYWHLGISQLGVNTTLTW